MPRPTPTPRAWSRALARWHTDATERGALVGAVVVAMVWASTSDSYARLWGTEIGGHDLTTWVADVPMALFFLAIGLELKAELTEGHLASVRASAVPIAGAVGGMVVPALVYLAVAHGTDGAAGWGIPMATDVAFAVAVVAVAGDAVPAAARVLVLALAVVDDIGAIAVIALAYGDGLEPVFLGAAVLALGGFVLVVRTDRSSAVQVAVGVVVWYLTFRSGVHPTIAAVALGLALPVRRADHLIEALRPWTGLVVLPLFALSHAGVDLTGGVLGAAASSPVAWGSGLGLALGKPVGVVTAIALVVRFGGARLPEGLRAGHVVGVGAVAGVGFTVALFVARLAFDGGPRTDEATIGILAGSLVAASLGAAVLRSTSRAQVSTDA